MPSTFMDLTNKLLREFNEVEITQTNFASVTSIQAAAKEAIQDAVLEINQLEYEWPFNATSQTDTLVVGQNEYSFPSTTKYVEWESFYILKDDSLNTNTKNLKFINREQWYRDQRISDLDAGSTGVSVPYNVFPSANGGYGVTPSPDKLYQVKYSYYSLPSLLINYNDEVTIPSRFDNVIIKKASIQMHLFRDNPESAAISEKQAEKLISRMRGILINKQPHMYEGRVNHDRYRFSGGYSNG